MLFINAILFRMNPDEDIQTLYPEQPLYEMIVRYIL